MNAPTSRTTYVLYTVGFLDLLGVSMIIPMLGLHARDLGASPTIIGILGSSYGFLQLFSSPVMGDWSDRAGRRIVLIYSLLFAGVGYFLLGSATSIFMLFLARIPAGLFKHSQEVAISYLGTSLPKSKHALVFGRFHAASSFGFIIGPVLGGHLADLTGGYHLVAITTSAFFLAATAIVWWLIPVDAPRPKRDDKEKPASSHSSSVLQLNLFLDNLRQMDWLNLWDIFIVRFLLGFASIIFRTNFSLSVDARFQVSGKQIGYIISYISIISTASGFFVGRISRWYRNDRRLLLHISIVQALSIGFSTFAPSMTILVISMAPLSVANAVARVCITNLTIERVKEDETGVVLGCGASILSVARMLSPLLGGLVYGLHEKGPGVVGITSAMAGMIVIITTGHIATYSKVSHHKTS